MADSAPVTVYVPKDKPTGYEAGGRKIKPPRKAKPKPKPKLRTFADV